MSTLGGEATLIVRFTGEIDDVRIYSLPLTKAEIAADMHGSAHSSALQQAARGDHGRTPSPPEDRNEACSGSPDPEDKNSRARQRRLAYLRRSRVLDCFHRVGRFDV